MGASRCCLSRWLRRSDFYYFLFELTPRPFELGRGFRRLWFVPIELSHERAFEVAGKLTPVGLAIDEPILQQWKGRSSRPSAALIPALGVGGTTSAACDS